MAKKLVPDCLNSSLWSSSPYPATDDRPRLAATEESPASPPVSQPSPPSPPLPVVAPHEPPSPKSQSSKSDLRDDADANGASTSSPLSADDISRQAQLLAELSKQIVDMREVKRLASLGIPDGAGIRATVWKKHHQGLRESMLTNLLRHFNSHVENNPENAVNFREIFVYEIFGFALKLALGRNVQSVHLEELGMTMSRKELYRVLVVDIMDSDIEVDWRDLFPCIKWIPNSLQTRLETVGFRRLAVMKALIKELKFQADSEEEMNSYLNFLRSEADNSVAET